MSSLIIVQLCLGGCTGVIDSGMPIEDTAWTLRVDADEALVDDQHVAFGTYPNPRGVKWMAVTLQDDGRLCASDGTKQWCGGPLQGIPYVTVLSAGVDSYCVKVVDIYGNSVRTGCREGAPPETFTTVLPDVPGPAGAESQDGAAPPQDGVKVGTQLVIDEINAGLAKIGLQARVTLPQSKALADFDQGDIILGKGSCKDVLDYLDSEFSDDHPGTDDYVFGKDAIKDCLVDGKCRVGQLVTRSMAAACAAIPGGVQTYMATTGIIGGGGSAVAQLCSGSGGTDEIKKCVGSPLVLDLRGDGLQLKGLGAGVTFPLSGAGPLGVAWLAGSDDALLALDVDGDGRITSGRELFGEATGGWAPDGFAALARFDEDKDGAITASDSVFSRLVAWRDDGDGRSEPGELLPLAELGIQSISLRRARSDQVDAFGNELRLVGSARATGGGAVPVIDVWFRMGAAGPRPAAR